MKKMLSFTVAIGLSITNTCILNTNATKESKINHTQYKSAQEQYELFLDSNSATPEKISQYEKMMEEHEQISNDNFFVIPRASDVRLGVPFRNQSEVYYCGPASVQQVIAYYNNNTNVPNQDDIADDLCTTTNGTDVYQIVNYLNNNTSQTYQSQWYFSSAANLYSYVIQDYSQRKPSIAFIENTNSSNWRYTVAAHFLCFEGYVDDTSTNANLINVVDPFYNGHHIANGKYSVTRDKAYAVTSALIT